MTESTQLEQNILSKSSRAAGLMAIERIYIAPKRMRDDTPDIRKYIEEELAPSIYEKGIIQPPVLHFNEDGTPFIYDGVEYDCELIAGWCRTQACISLGMSQIPYVNQANLREDQKFELELAENFDRRGFTWQEKVLGIYTTHRTKQLLETAEGHTWGQRETGKLLGFSHGYIGECERISKAIMSGDEEIKNAPSFTDAKKILLGRKSDEAMKALAAATGAVPTAAKATPIMGPVRPSAGISLADAMLNAKTSALATPSPTGPPSGIVPQASLVTDFNINLGNILFNMDNKEYFAQCPDETFNLIYTDIPYGIDMENLDFNADDLDRVSDEHDVQENIEQMEGFLKNAYRVLKDSSYLLFWMDIKHWEKLVVWGEQAGFSVCPYPFIWNKLHPCRNRAGNIWPTKAIEYVMVMRKGKGLMRKPMTKNFFEADGSAERKLQRNPFSKPFAISKHLLEHFVIPGDKMLDCYAGEGSLVCAGLQMGLQVTAVEKKEVHFNRLMERVKGTYNTLTRNQATFTFAPDGH